MDTVDVKREARRRRILLNSDDRFRKIRGEQVDLKQDVSLFAENMPMNVKLDTEFTEPNTQDWEKEAAITDHEEISTQPIKPISRFLIYRIHVLLLAVIIRLLLYFNLGYLFGEMALVPLATLHVILSHVYPESYSSRVNKSSGLVGATLLLSGFAKEKTRSFINAYNYFTNIMGDICIYVFTFILIHVLMSMLLN